MTEVMFRKAQAFYDRIVWVPVINGRRLDGIYRGEVRRIILRGDKVKVNEEE